MLRRLHLSLPILYALLPLFTPLELRAANVEKDPYKDINSSWERFE